MKLQGYVCGGDAQGIRQVRHRRAKRSMRTRINNFEAKHCFWKMSPKFELQSDLWLSCASARSPHWSARLALSHCSALYLALEWSKNRVSDGVSSEALVLRAEYIRFWSRWPTTATTAINSRPFGGQQSQRQISNWEAIFDWFFRSK